MFLTAAYLGLIINRINIPFDKGANDVGSKNAPKTLKPYFDYINIDKDYTVNTNNFVSNILSEGYQFAEESFRNERFPFVVGGDHTVAISSVFAANQYSRWNHQKLGVLWCDAHADFNTVETSPSKNLHGMPVAVLCGHTLPNLQMAEELYPRQFAYFGLRDVDSLELIRLQEHDMNILDCDRDIDEWIDRQDNIHLSFDIDCLDPSVTKCVNTPVENGKSLEEVIRLFEKVKKSKKLISLDLVEYNDKKGNDHKMIADLMKHLLI